MNKIIKILHLEDSIKDSELIHSLIEGGIEGTEYLLADNEKDFINFLETENIDIILSDYSLPDYNGNEALKFAREKYSHMPFIFISGAMGEDAAINAMLNGATDYVLKNKLERLVPAIKRALKEHDLEIKRIQDEIHLKEKNEQIEAQNEQYIQINKELEIAKVKAEESDKIKSIFLTNLSHELRTPLNGILGFSQLITGTNDKQQIIDFAKIINKGGNQLLDIIEDLFIISSILSENISMNIKNIQLDSLLNKARFIINDEILKSDKSGLTFSIFETSIEENAIVLADYDMFGEIIRKLIRNAIMFTNSGKIEIGYRFESRINQIKSKKNESNMRVPDDLNLKNEKNSEEKTDEKENILFYIKDTGIGIPVEKQEIIFDFFRQVEESASKKFGGIGSGLAICKSFVEKMNGKIWVESQPEKGSTFYLTLPVIIDQSEKELLQKVQLKDELKLDMSGKTVLIVDDAASNRLYLEFVIKNLGAKVFSAENGKDALDLVKKTKSIDLVLMDLNMPVMDGYESTSLIKKIRPDIIVIVQTAYSLPEHIEKAFSSGCDDFVKKPINVNELIITMNKCLTKSEVLHE